MKIAFATFVLVFLRALQQQNVVHGNYLLAATTPFAIAAAEVASIVMVVQTGFGAVPYVGIGGALGATSAMWIHRRIRKP
jgi:hypothetical protein